jgi:hypothetical protein
MQDTFVISASSDPDDYKQKKQIKKDSKFRNFTKMCDGVLPTDMNQGKKVATQLGGMSHLLESLHKQKKLNDFDSKLLQHAIVALPTKDELLLRGVVRDAFNSY